MFIIQMLVAWSNCIEVPYSVEIPNIEPKYITKFTGLILEIPKATDFAPF